MKRRFSIRNIWKNKWMLISGTAAICLFGVAPSKLIAEIGIFALLALIIWSFVWENSNPQKKFKTTIALLSAIFDFSLVSGFISVWSPSRKVAALAGRFGLSAKAFLLALGVMGGLVAFYFLYALLFWVIARIEKSFQLQPVTELSTCIKNVKSNWYVPISALAFFCLESQAYLAYYIGVVIAFLCIVFVSSQKMNIVSFCKSEPLALKIFAAFSAMGMCLAGKRAFYNSFVGSRRVGLLPYGTQILYFLYLLSILGAVVGLIFAFLFITAILSFVRRKITEAGLFKRISRLEWAIYAVIFILLVTLSTSAFMQSQAFYGTDYSYDVIYTSDSPALVKNAADLWLSYAENDLRQPLFAVFAAPFTGGMYFIAAALSKVLSISNGLAVSLENIAQVALMLCATILLVDMTVDKKSLRICFFLTLCSSYTVLLSSLMMEQYIVAYFWLILAIYCAKHSEKHNAVAYCGATGTLLTSGIIFPIYARKRENQHWTEYLSELFESGFKAVIEFAALLIAFSRFDVIYNLSSKVNSLSRFTGTSVSISDKLLQYLSFIANCFVSPDAGVDTVTESYISWQLALPTTVNVLGVIIIVLSVVSVIINRKDISVRVAGCWALFSFVILFVLGWGTAENGLILYSLYFCWAFFTLLFKLLETFSEKVHLKYLPHLVSLACCGTLLWFNVQGIRDMISFAIAYYPV